ncbi:MAG: type I-C CRISPR-associated protein Cas5 [Deltaproteobacteria bacterium RIFOXYA12_FULL_61_11]|nr:MAG: type I-C CRISPR-associated protein Cas5 [Deltaproteobacteria bacterium RIFOXYA12_FULL_61_11]
MTDTRPRSAPFRIVVWGDNACFTRPEMKVERVSYDVMTPSAARGILEAILWKPAIRWIVERIDILNPIKWASVRRNEVGAVMSPRTDGLLVEENRQQRAGLFLRDVRYVLHARFELTAKAGPEDSVIKFQEMFLRRAEKGQCFHRPYLGCREFAAEFALLAQHEGPSQPIDHSQDLGFMLYDLEHDPAAQIEGNHHCGPNCRAAFFRAELRHGSLLVPPPDSPEVRR